MRAVVVRRTGGPDQLVVEDIPDPEPGPGEVRIRVAAAGVNFIDVYHRTGRMVLPLPFTPGMEAAGVVDAVGPEVHGVELGDRFAHPFRAGAYAELQVVAADRIVHVPEAVPLRIAAASMLQGLTAHYLTTSTFPIAPGHTALVHAGAGGLGLLLTQVAVASGAPADALINSDAVGSLERDALRLHPVDLLDAISAVGACREALDRNGAPELQFERLLLSIATSLYVRGATSA